MKKIAIIAGIALCLGFLAVSLLGTPATSMPIQNRFVPLGYQQLTLSSSAQALTVPAGATVAVFRVETANARWRDDGTLPTTSAGFPLLSTDTVPFEYAGTLSALEFIAQSGSPVLDVTYYRQAG